MGAAGSTKESQFPQILPCADKDLIRTDSCFSWQKMFQTGDENACQSRVFTPVCLSAAFCRQQTQQGERPAQQEQF